MGWLKGLLLAAAVLAAAFAGVVAVEYTHHLLGYRFVGLFGPQPWQTSVYALVHLAIPVVAAAGVAFSLRAWWPWPVSLPAVTGRRRWLSGILAGGYALTACVGVPTVQTDLTDMALREYSFEREYRESDSPLTSRAFMAVPLLPGVVVTYYEYQAGGLNGRGGFYLYLWYGTGVRYVTRYTTWVS